MATSKSKSTGAKAATGRRRTKKAAAEPLSRGLSAAQVAGGSPPAKVDGLTSLIEDTGGRVLATYRDPLGSHWQVLAALPVNKVEPTPFQAREQVNEAVKTLKDRGFTSPYLKAFVVARVDPLRFKRGAKAGSDETIEKMLASARRFDAKKIKMGDVAGAGGPG